MDSEEFSWYLV